jgi:Flavin containing amine oxidoreductase
MARISALPMKRASIMYNTVMTSVVARSAPESGISVTTADRKELHFDAVVVTVPLVYLQRHKDCIRPEYNLESS